MKISIMEEVEGEKKQEKENKKKKREKRIKERSNERAKEADGATFYQDIIKLTFKIENTSLA